MGALRQGVAAPIRRGSARHVARRLGAVFAMAAILGVVGTGGSAPAAAQSNELRVVVDQLDRLRADVTELQRQFYGEGVAPARTRTENVARSAGTEIRLTALDEELRRVTGLIEELEHRIDGIGGRLDKLVADVDFRLVALEESAASRPLGPGEPAQPGGAEVAARATNGESDTAPAQALPEGTPAERYDYAIGLLRAGEFDRAERAFGSFVTTHPDDGLAGNAQYWLGETHYVREQYEQAATAFLDGYQRYPDSPKAPDNLLKLGMTLGTLGQRAEACATLDELATKFPDAARPIQDRASRERRTLDCP